MFSTLPDPVPCTKSVFCPDPAGRHESGTFNYSRSFLAAELNLNGQERKTLDAASSPTGTENTSTSAQSHDPCLYLLQPFNSVLLLHNI